MAINACVKKSKTPKLPPIAKDNIKNMAAKIPYLQKGFLKLDPGRFIFLSLDNSSSQADLKHDGNTRKKNEKKLSSYFAVTASLSVPTYLW